MYVPKCADARGNRQGHRDAQRRPDDLQTAAPWAPRDPTSGGSPPRNRRTASPLAEQSVAPERRPVPSLRDLRRGRAPDSFWRR
jgi:hypothetical protein